MQTFHLQTQFPSWEMLTTVYGICGANKKALSAVNFLCDGWHFVMCRGERLYMGSDRKSNLKH